MSNAEQLAISKFREMIISGQIGPGEKVTEVSLSKQIGLSRTPVRMALARLEIDGLLSKREGRGYLVKEVNLADIEKAVMVRGSLEGLAAGYMASHGMSSTAVKCIRESLSMSQSIVDKVEISVADLDLYQEANTLFHETIMHHCGNEFIASSYERIKHLPMLGLGVFDYKFGHVEGERTRITVAHSQHRIVIDAIEMKEAMRAEMMMREHSNAILRYAQLFVGAFNPKVAKLFQNS